MTTTRKVRGNFTRRRNEIFDDLFATSFEMKKQSVKQKRRICAKRRFTRVCVCVCVLVTIGEPCKKERGKKGRKRKKRDGPLWRLAEEIGAQRGGNAAQCQKRGNCRSAPTSYAMCWLRGTARHGAARRSTARRGVARKAYMRRGSARTYVNAYCLTPSIKRPPPRGGCITGTQPVY